ncbi:MAG: heme exporter protein CcmB [Thiohalomonadaceae bacterium]
MSLLRAGSALLRRDLSLAMRQRGQWLNPLLFFVLVVALFPLGLNPDPNLLRTIAPGVIWVGALLAAMLSLETLFRSDFDDGSLEQMALTSHPLALLVLAKSMAHWLVSGLPLLLMAPLLALLLNLESHAVLILLTTLALGTPLLSLIGGIGVALTVGLRRGGVLLSLLVLPLYVPVLIFAAGAVGNAQAGMAVTGQLAFLGALLALAIALAPLATAAALRISLD